MSDIKQGDLEQRVLELEKRVKQLEQGVMLDKEQTPQSKVEQATNNEYESPVNNLKPQVFMKENIRKKDKVSKKKIGEAEIGKYLVGILAAVLIFIAAASFISLIWASLSDAMRLSLILISGLLLTTTGFCLIRKSKNPISSLILGTGAGLIFISIISANMFFNFIGNITSIILVAIWSIFFILSYKYTRMFFTSIIAYIGSIVALLLGASITLSNNEFIALMLYVTSISATLVITSHKWLDEQKKIISILLSMLSYAILLMIGFGLEDFNLILYFIIIIEYILFNYMYYRVEKLGKKQWAYLIVNALVSIITLMFLSRVNSGINSNISVELAWFFAINLMQMIIFEFFTKSIRRVNIFYYVIIQAITAIIFNIDKFNTFGGMSILSIVLIVFQILNRHSNYRTSITVIIIIDTLLSYFTFLKSDIALLYGLLQIISATYLIYNTYNHENYSKSVIKEGIFKIIWMIVYLVNAYFITNNIVDFIIKNAEVTTHSHRYREVISYMVLSIATCTIVASGYFKDWKSDKFKWFTKNETVLEDKISLVFYIILSVVYFFGLYIISLPDVWHQQLIAILSVVAVALVQSKNLVDNYKNQALVGLWIGFKYSALTWTIMYSVWNIKLESVLMSVAGLTIALLSIALGFKLKMKSLRLYGLIITILMVLKFIAIDLSQENSIIRIVALFIGGIICFGITLLYNKLNKEND